MERRGAIVGIAFAVFLFCLLLYALNLTEFVHSGNYDSSIDVPFGHSLSTLIPQFVLSTTKYAPKKIFSHKGSIAIRGNTNKGKITVFKGREANKNQAILEILEAKGPLPISELQKLLNKRGGLEITYYASLNKRVHALEKAGYITQVGQVAASPRGFKASLYEARAKFYLARLLNSTSSEEILSRLSETDAEIILADLVNARV